MDINRTQLYGVDLYTTIENFQNTRTERGNKGLEWAQEELERARHSALSRFLEWGSYGLVSGDPVDGDMMVDLPNGSIVISPYRSAGLPNAQYVKDELECWRFDKLGDFEADVSSSIATKKYRAYPKDDPPENAIFVSLGVFEDDRAASFMKLQKGERLGWHDCVPYDRDTEDALSKEAEELFDDLKMVVAAKFPDLSAWFDTMRDFFIYEITDRLIEKDKEDENEEEEEEEEEVRLIEAQRKALDESFKAQHEKDAAEREAEDKKQARLKREEEEARREQIKEYELTSEQKEQELIKHFTTNGQWRETPMFHGDMEHTAQVLDGMGVIKWESNYYVIHGPTGTKYTKTSKITEARAIALWLVQEYDLGRKSGTELGHIIRNNPTLIEVAREGLSVLPEALTEGLRLQTKRVTLEGREQKPAKPRAPRRATPKVKWAKGEIPILFIQRDGTEEESLKPGYLSNVGWGIWDTGLKGEVKWSLIHLKSGGRAFAYRTIKEVKEVVQRIEDKVPGLAFGDAKTLLEKHPWLPYAFKQQWDEMELTEEDRKTMEEEKQAARVTEIEKGRIERAKSILHYTISHLVPPDAKKKEAIDHEMKKALEENRFEIGPQKGGVRADIAEKVLREMVIEQINDRRKLPIADWKKTVKVYVDENLYKSWSEKDEEVIKEFAETLTSKQQKYDSWELQDRLRFRNDTIWGYLGLRGADWIKGDARIKKIIGQALLIRVEKSGKRRILFELEGAYGRMSDFLFLLRDLSVDWTQADKLREKLDALGKAGGFYLGVKERHAHITEALVKRTAKLLTEIKAATKAVWDKVMVRDRDIADYVETQYSGTLSKMKKNPPEGVPGKYVHIGNEHYIPALNVVSQLMTWTDTGVEGDYIPNAKFTFKEIWFRPAKLKDLCKDDVSRLSTFLRSIKYDDMSGAVRYGGKVLKLSDVRKYWTLTPEKLEALTDDEYSEDLNYLIEAYGVPPKNPGMYSTTKNEDKVKWVIPEPWEVTKVSTGEYKVACPLLWRKENPNWLGAISAGASLLGALV